MTTQIPTFNPGDTVIMLCGGPAMLVEFQNLQPFGGGFFGPVIQDGVYCVWFDKQDRLQRGRFNPHHIRKLGIGE